MTSNRPYLIRALFEWLLDNELTPHLLVDAEAEHVVVPTQFVEQGRIVLNISPSAVRDLQLGNTLISFNARFGAAAMDVMFPPTAVLGIYARENGRGMLFAEEEPEPPTDDDPDSRSSRDRPSLKVVK